MNIKWTLSTVTGYLVPRQFTPTWFSFHHAQYGAVWDHPVNSFWHTCGGHILPVYL